MEQTAADYDIVFMDIEMSVLNGIETAKKIRKSNQKMVIIFVTDYQEYVYDVFDVLPFRFLRKPCSEEEVLAVLF